MSLAKPSEQATSAPKLLRSEVLLARRVNETDDGAPLLLASGSSGWLSGLFMLLIALALLLLLLIPYKQTESASGILQRRGPLQSLHATDSAVVGRVLVGNGEAVTAGQALLELLPNARDLSGASASEHAIRRLDLKRERLNEQQRLQRQLSEQNERRLQQQLGDMVGELKRREHQSSLLQQQLLLSESALQQLEALRGAAALPALELNQRRASHMELRRQISLAAGEIEKIRGQRAQLQGALNTEALQASLAESRFDGELKDLALERGRLDGQRGEIVVAGFDGVVRAIHVRSGQQLSLGQQLLDLAAAGEALKATLYVPASVRGRLEPGQEILLSYASFPVAEFGRYQATLDSLSEAPVDPRFTPLPVPGLSEPVFVATATPLQHYVTGAEPFALQSGERLSAEFVGRQQSLMAFLLSPLFSLKGKLW